MSVILIYSTGLNSLVLDCLSDLSQATCLSLRCEEEEADEEEEEVSSSLDKDMEAVSYKDTISSAVQCQCQINIDLVSVVKT